MAIDEPFSAELERQKLDAMKELAYGASHEINNPLANIAARAQTLLRDEEQPDRRRALEAIHQQAMRAHEMISDLMLFARPPELRLQPFDLCRLAEQVVKKHAEQCERRSICIAARLTRAPFEILADEQQLAVALEAMVVNAIEAIGERGTIEIVLTHQPATTSEPERACIEVQDTGTGISEEIRRHLFDPFYSGREAGRGLGFGLSKCWRIVTDHGGEVVVSNNADRGATLSLYLPIAGPTD